MKQPVCFELKHRQGQFVVDRQMPDCPAIPTRTDEKTVFLPGIEEPGVVHRYIGCASIQ